MELTKPLFPHFTNSKCLTSGNLTCLQARMTILRRRRPAAMPQMARVRVLTGSGTSSRSSLAEIMPAEAKVRTGREISGYYNLGNVFDLRSVP